MGKYTLKINRERMAEARQRMTDFYMHRKSDRAPFCYYSGDGGDCPAYTNRQIIEDPDKKIQQTIARINAQTEAYTDTDFLPFLTLDHLGEGLVPSLFGATQYIVDGNPPYTEGRVMKDIFDLDKIPERIDPDKDGWGPLMKDLVTKFLDATNGEIPIGVSDHQSPYGCATKIIQNEELMYAMYDEPELVHKFFDRITTGIEDTIEALQRWLGKDHVVLNYNAPVPNGDCGLILWDDYISVVSPQLHTEFCKPYNDRLYAKFGVGHLHTCGPYFPGYIDAALVCKPRSLDFAIMRGFNRSKDDMLEFRRITREHGIILTGNPASCENHIFAGPWAPIDDDYLREMANGGMIYSSWGAPEQGDEATKKWIAICDEVGNK